MPVRRQQLQGFETKNNANEKQDQPEEVTRIGSREQNTKKYKRAKPL
jgi:hypothetical protein